MITDEFVLTIKDTGTEWELKVVEDNTNDELTYAVTIVKPEDFAQMQEMEQPVMMKYDAGAGELKWHSWQDLGMEDIESKFSKAIINRNM